MVTRVLVVDDSGFFRRRIVEILEADPALKVIGTASNGQEAIAQVAALKPDVVTMDIEMPVMDSGSPYHAFEPSAHIDVLIADAHRCTGDTQGIGSRRCRFFTQTF